MLENLIQPNPSQSHLKETLNVSIQISTQPISLKFHNFYNFPKTLQTFRCHFLAIFRVMNFPFP